MDGEAAPLADGTAQVDSATMCLDDVFDNSQTQANALRVALQFRATPIEPFEDSGVVFRWNAFAVVFDVKFEDGGFAFRPVRGVAR